MTKKIQKQKNSKEKISVNKPIEVKLGEKLNIDHAEEIKEILIKKLGNEENIKFHSANCESIDLTFIQLIHSLHKTAKKTKKKILIDIPLQEEQKELFKNAGININSFISENNNTVSINIRGNN